MFEPLTSKSLALAAVASATAASGDLLQFIADDTAGPCRSFEEDTIPQLADALKMTIEVAAVAGDGPTDAEGKELLGQLQGALVRFLEGWA